MSYMAQQMVQKGGFEGIFERVNSRSEILLVQKIL